LVAVAPDAVAIGVIAIGRIAPAMETGAAGVAGAVATVAVGTGAAGDDAAGCAVGGIGADEGFGGVESAGGSPAEGWAEAVRTVVAMPGDWRGGVASTVTARNPGPAAEAMIGVEGMAVEFAGSTSGFLEVSMAPVSTMLSRTCSPPRACMGGGVAESPGTTVETGA
jgi:hypothetical protein